MLAGLAGIAQGLAMAGRGAGAQPGDWQLRVVESADIVDDRLSLEGLREIGVRQGASALRHTSLSRSISL